MKVLQQCSFQPQHPVSAVSRDHTFLWCYMTDVFYILYTIIISIDYSVEESEKYETGQFITNCCTCVWTG